MQPPTYYAILQLDGDKMGEKGRLKAGPNFQRDLSKTITDFAGNVHTLVENANVEGDADLRWR